MPDDDDSPRLYDRPCVEVDSIGETGHKFFCECNVPDQKQTIKGNFFSTLFVALYIIKYMIYFSIDSEILNDNHDKVFQINVRIK